MLYLFTQPPAAVRDRHHLGYIHEGRQSSGGVSASLIYGDHVLTASSGRAEEHKHSDAHSLCGLHFHYRLISVLIKYAT